MQCDEIARRGYWVGGGLLRPSVERLPCGRADDAGRLYATDVLRAPEPAMVRSRCARGTTRLVI